ncbi:cysteine synthase [Nitzschia inconspicua]|uniref:Cysteine synthase 1 n=1 Tax=Nitzschia inconspicua TaxID=303405 RepID=A0A9K3PUI8_9STRA|nr:cysteine synthase [Nitzschia inconspicua]
MLSAKEFVPAVYNGFVDAIGNTPLIRLKAASERTGCDIYGKAEFLNPGGSVKDRAAKYLIEGLERDGKIQPGGTVVEGTAGNTGIGLTYVANAKGYRSVIVIPRTQTQEKKDTLRQAGATLIEVDAKPYSHPNNYIKLSGRLAECIPNACWANQFDNVDNRRAHYETTAPEIIKQLPNVSAFSCAIGTGGTLAGCAMYFREHHPNVKIGHTDPCGAKLHRWYKDGELKAEGNSITEGIGQGRVTANLEGFTPDYTYEIDDEAALQACFELLQHEGLALGMSSGINVAGAERMAKEMGPGHTLVTILCDSSSRYQGKMFNREFLKSNGLPEPTWIDPALPSEIAQAVENAKERDD